MGDTYVVSTPSGGFHVYHTYEERYDHWTGKIGLTEHNIDIRTTGNFILGAGSKYNSKEGNCRKTYTEVNGTVDTIKPLENDEIYNAINSKMHENKKQTKQHILNQ